MSDHLTFSAALARPCQRRRGLCRNTPEPMSDPLTFIAALAKLCQRRRWPCGDTRNP